MTLHADSTPLDIYRLSPTQEGMLFHTLYAPGDGVYFEQRWCLLQGELDAEAFREAWQQVTDRHDVLRTAFHWQELERPMQVLYDRVALPFAQQDWRALPESARAARLDAWLAADRARGFALDQAPLMRCALFALGPKLHRFVWSYHHLLMDGWCNGVLIAEVLALYAAARRGAVAALPPVRPYRDFIDWLDAQDAAASENYWREQLAHVDAPTSPGVLRAADPARAPRFEERQLTLDAALGEALHDHARSARLTPNTLLQAAWSLWLARTTGQREVLSGAALANRPPTLDGAERMVGLFINSVPVAVTVDDDAASADWLQSLQSAARQRELHGHFPLADMQRLSSVPAGTPLFDSILVFENYPLSTAMALAAGDSGLTLDDAAGFERTHYPLALMVLPEQAADGRRTLTLCLRFDAARLEPAAARRLLDQIEAVLRGLISPDTRRLGDIVPIGADEWAQQRAAGRGPERTAPPALLPARVAHQARLSPDAPALVSDDETLDYRELDRRIDALAQRLRRAGVARGARVGVCVQRSAALPLALLAVLRAGAAYVPLDPDYPADRLAWIAADAGLTLILTHGLNDAQHALLPAGIGTLTLDTASSGDDAAGDALPPVAADDCAYVLYTSGSTGRPKGVAIGHASLACFIEAMLAEPGLRAGDRLLAVTTMSFDIAALELFAPLACGATVVLASAGQARDARQLAARIAHDDINVMQATPATWRMLQATGWAGSAKLRVLCGGEALDPALANWLLAHTAAVWNMYGPTETTIWSAALRVQPQYLHGTTSSVPVGGPIAGTTLCVLDDAQRPLPTGAPGELCIAGAGLAQGYLNRPDLTSAAFVHGPEGTTVYRTGDRVRLREDGLFEFLGRTDRQVKLRGFRIELGEIEAVLAAVAGVVQVAVLLRDDAPAAGPQLVAYPVLREGGEAALADVQAAARARLPAHMLPSAWCVLDALPLTPNGKIDRRALPAPGVRTTGESAPRAPMTVLQDMVAGVWAQVLELPGEPALHDDFFALGGHSLPATRVIARLQALHAVDVPLRTLFEHPRLDDFCAQVDALRSAGTPAEAAIEWLPRDGRRLPLSRAQQRQWLIASLAPDSVAYTIPLALRLRGALQPDGLRWSLQQLVARHETLRLAFRQQDGLPHAELLTLPPADLPLVDLGGLAPFAREQALQDALRTQVRTPFDLAQPPLWRAQLLRMDAGEHVLAITLHHIVADDWSLGVLVRELGTLYRAWCDGRADAAVLPPLPLQYADFADWQRTQDMTPALDYWREALADLPPPLELPQRRTPGTAPAAGRCELRLDAGLSSVLRGLGRECGTTLFMTLLAGFQTLLARYSGARDIVVGTPVANRRRADVQGLMGMFVNTLMLRGDLSGDPAVDALLAQVRARTLAAWDHQELPFEQVLETLSGQEQARRGQRGEALQLLFSLQGAPLETLDLAGLEWSPLSVDAETAKFELSLSVRETQTAQGSELACSFDYRADLFDAATIARMAGHYRRLLEQMTQRPQARLSELAMLSPDELARLATFCSGAPASRAAGSIHAAFARQAAATPHAIAVSDGAQQCSYAALEQRANRLAYLLRARGVGVETPVGLWGERSLDMVVAMLAVLKAGGFFVPLDAQAPPARLGLIARGAGLRMALVAQAGSLQIDGADVTELALDRLDAELAAQPDTPPAVVVGPDHLAYAMHTSGSTGLPKGVCAAHRGVLRLVLDADYVELGPDTVMLHAAPLAFDASTLELWGTLLNGGRLVIQRCALASLDDTAQLIVREAVNTLWLTAGLFNLMVDEQPEALRGVRQLLAGGDVLSVPHVRRIRAALPQLRLINGYGPTEATTFTCCHTVRDEDCVDAAGTTLPVPIGRPIPGTRLHLLDADLQPVPLGVAGDLYIGGDGLARGYLGQPAASAEAFVPNPFFDLNDAGQGDVAHMLYRSGDRARLREDGTVDFLGRADQQIKIRGFRIEPTEIEQRLTTHPAVQDVVVDARAIDGRRHLVAWYTRRAGAAEPGAVALRAHLAPQLPDYMLPSAFVAMDALPLTPSGKVERRALPLPHAGDALMHEALPASALEAALLDVWRTLLPGAGLGPHSNFFDAGGDSILAMQIASRAMQAGLPLTPALIFEHQTVAALAQALAGGVLDTAWVEAPQRPAGEVALTPIQHWFFEQDLAVPSHFNQAVMLRLPHDIDRVALGEVYAHVIERHDAFRLRFVRGAQGWAQHYDDAAATPGIEPFDLTALAPAAQDAAVEGIGNRLQGGLDITHGPLLRTALIDLGAARGLRLFIVAHHLVIDGVSWRVLLGGLQQAWRQQAVGRAIALGPKPHSVQQWSQALQAQVPAPEVLARWQEIVCGAPAGLPLEGPGGRNVMADAAIHPCVLDADATATLLHELPRQWQASVQDALLAALLRACIDWTGSDALLIDLESHGRDADLAPGMNFTQTAGWFTALYPVCLQPAPGGRRDTVQAIAARLQSLPDGGLSYGMLRYLQGHDALALAPDVAFNYLGQLDAGPAGQEGFGREAAPGPVIHPDNVRAHLIDINCWVEAGTLRMAWCHGIRHHPPARVAVLAAAMRDELSAIAAACRDAPAAATVAGNDFIDDLDLAAVLAQVSFSTWPDDAR